MYLIKYKISVKNYGGILSSDSDEAYTEYRERYADSMEEAQEIFDTLRGDDQAEDVVLYKELGCPIQCETCLG